MHALMGAIDHEIAKLTFRNGRAIQGNSWLHYQICTYSKYQFATAYIDGDYLGGISFLRFSDELASLAVTTSNQVVSSS